LVASFGVIHRPSYYTSQPATYYQVDADAGGIWLRGNDRLGVVQGSAVDPVVFDRLCEGCDADGNKLVKTPIFKRRMLGVDITLSSPKSVSVLYAVGDPALRDSIASAERAAVEATIRMIEKEIPLARRGRDGLRRQHALFTVAVFSHSEARPEVHADGSELASVQRHHHLCLPSICEVRDPSGDFDGTAQSTFLGINSVALRSWKKSLGACYRLQLATELQQRGFAIDRDEDGWRWSIAAVPEAVCKYFSARRTAIEAELAKAGLTSTQAPAVAAAITRNNRRAKEADQSVDRFARWRKAVEELGFDPDNIVASARDAGRDAAAQNEAADLQDLIRLRMAVVPAALTTSEATFERQHLVEAACNALVGTGASVAQAAQETDSLIESRAVVELGETRNGPVLSTPAMVAIERRLVETSVDLARARVTAPNPDLVRRLCQRDGLSEEQLQVALTATSGRRLTCVLAPAGSGKSTVLEAIARGFEAEGYKVRGASVAWRAAIDLGQSVQIPSIAVDAMLARADARVAEGQPAFERKTVCVVDESALQSSPQLGRLLDHINNSRSSILVLVGDQAQLRPIGPGHAIRLVRESVGAATLTQIHRQREIWAQEAPQAFARGDAKAALEAYSSRGLIEFHDGLKPTVEALADAWQEARLAAPNDKVIVLAKTNAESRAVASVLRDRLKRDGTLGKREILLPAVDASGNAHTLPIAVGDHLIALRRNDRLGVVNGSPLMVQRINVDHAKAITISARRGDDIISFTPDDFADAKGRVRLANGLVSTIFRSQGVTVDQAFILLNDRYDRHDAYVCTSRSRSKNLLYCSRKTIDAAIRAETGEYGDSLDDTARIEHLARRLSRERVKTTTLDLTDIAKYAQRHADRARQRETGLSHEL
jgi:conjugative relaxase-like TrwC/TraI family protein